MLTILTNDEISHLYNIEFLGMMLYLSHTFTCQHTHTHTITFKFQSLLNTFLNTMLHKKHMPGISINNRNNPCQDFFCFLMFLSMSYTALLCVFAPNVLNLFVQVLKKKLNAFCIVLSSAPLLLSVVCSSSGTNHRHLVSFVQQSGCG